MELKDFVEKIIREEIEKLLDDKFYNDARKPSDIPGGYDGFYIVRTNRAGVFFGKIIKRRENSLIMNECRKLHYWDGAGAVEQIARDGVSLPDNCRFTVPVDGSEVVEWIQVLPCTQKSVDSIKGVKLWKE
jgi:hypothetical protein